MQNGVAMRSGELLASLFMNQKISNYFDSFCNDKFKVLEKFAKNIKSKRHKVIIANIMFMIQNNNLKIPTKLQRCNFLRNDLNKMNLLKKLTDDIFYLIDTAFGQHVLGHRSISNKMTQNIYYTIVFIIGTHAKINCDNLNKSNTISTKFRSAIRKFCRQYDKSKNKKALNVMEKIKTTIIKNYTNMIDDDLSG